jgi:hypothetical protein
MLLNKLKLFAGALLIGGSLVSLAAFFASPGHEAIAQFTQETRSARPNPGAAAGQELSAKLDQSTALASKLQKEVQELRAELQALRATMGRGAGTQSGKVDPTASMRLWSAPVDHGKSAYIPPTPATRTLFSDRTANASTSPQYFPYRRLGGLIFAASPTGNRVIAYDPNTRWTSSLELRATKENPLKVSFAANPSERGQQGLVAISIEGEQITRIAGFDLKSQTWHAQDLSEPVRGQAIPYIANAISYDLGPHLYTFNPQSLSWDHLDVGAIGDAGGEDGSSVNEIK